MDMNGMTAEDLAGCKVEEMRKGEIWEGFGKNVERILEIVGKAGRKEI